LYALIGAGGLVVIAVAAYILWPNATAPAPATPKQETTASQPAAAPQIAGMVYIPPGTFLFGEKKEPRELKRGFYIDETEVSNAEYCDAMGCAEKNDLPKVNLTVREAREYATKAGKRLPTSEEWERALRGTDGKLFPWGDQPDASKANVGDNPAATHEAMAVRSYSGPPYNMIGNVWEMVDGPITPSQAAMERMSKQFKTRFTATEPWITTRGGSYAEPLNSAYAYDANSLPERHADKNIGFRCVRDLPDNQTK